MQEPSLPTEKKGYIFIHGAGLGAWIWEDVIAAIDAPTYCIDFPLRDGATEARKQLTFEAYVQAAYDQAMQWNVPQVVIVAHSIGGVVAVELAALLGDRLAGFVAVGAAIPRSGGSFLSCLGFPKQTIMGTMMRMIGTQPPASAIAKGLCNDLDETQTKTVIARFAAESLALYTGTVKHEIAGSVPQLYVLLSKDQEFGRAMQHKMASHLPAAQMATLDTGHLPMLSQPTALANLITRL